MLQLEHRLRVEEVILAVAPPLILATGFELLRPDRLPPERTIVAYAHFLRDDLDAHATDA